jgi:hypothetical protein
VEIGGFDDYYIAKGDENDGYGTHWYPGVGSSWWEIDLLDAFYGGKTIK